MEPRFCTELHIEEEESIAAAAEERRDNLKTMPRFNTKMAEALIELEEPAMAIFYTKMWKRGRTIPISFMGSVDPVVKGKIIAIANRWMQHADLTFDWVNTGGIIRISTTPGGSWSYVGTDAKLIDAQKPTMNYGWLEPDTSDTEYERVVLHEFGHALGAIHEHQHPSAGIPWDKPKVYAYYARMGWSQEKVDHNIFRKYAASQLNASAYDKLSIMHYAVPNDLTIGEFEVDWNTQLSENDKALVERVY